MFNMAVGAIGEWLNLVPFFVGGRTVDSGGGGRFLKYISWPSNTLY